jgi:hypothetical protein
MFSYSLFKKYKINNLTDVDWRNEPESIGNVIITYAEQEALRKINDFIMKAFGSADFFTRNDFKIVKEKVVQEVRYPVEKIAEKEIRNFKKDIIGDLKAKINWDKPTSGQNGPEDEHIGYSIVLSTARQTASTGSVTKVEIEDMKKGFTGHILLRNGTLPASR